MEKTTIKKLSIITILIIVIIIISIGVFATQDSYRLTCENAQHIEQFVSCVRLDYLLNK